MQALCLLPNTVRLIKSFDSPAALLAVSVYLPSSVSLTLLMTRLCLSVENVRPVLLARVVSVVLLNFWNCHFKLSGFIKGSALLQNQIEQALNNIGSQFIPTFTIMDQLMQSYGKYCN